MLSIVIPEYSRCNKKVLIWICYIRIRRICAYKYTYRHGCSPSILFKLYMQMVFAPSMPITVDCCEKPNFPLPRIRVNSIDIYSFQENNYVNCQLMIFCKRANVGIMLFKPQHGFGSLQDTVRRRHNKRHGVSDHLRLDCLPNRFLRRRSKKTSRTDYRI